MLSTRISCDLNTSTALALLISSRSYHSALSSPRPPLSVRQASAAVASEEDYKAALLECRDALVGPATPRESTQHPYKMHWRAGGEESHRSGQVGVTPSMELTGKRMHVPWLQAKFIDKMNANPIFVRGG